jgi:hypothetical protein
MSNKIEENMQSMGDLSSNEATKHQSTENIT